MNIMPTAQDLADFANTNKKLTTGAIALGAVGVAAGMVMTAAGMPLAGEIVVMSGYSVGMVAGVSKILNWFGASDDQTPQPLSAEAVRAKLTEDRQSANPSVGRGSTPQF